MNRQLFQMYKVAIEGQQQANDWLNQNLNAWELDQAKKLQEESNSNKEEIVNLICQYICTTNVIIDEKLNEWNIEDLAIDIYLKIQTEAMVCNPAILAFIYKKAAKSCFINY